MVHVSVFLVNTNCSFSDMWHVAGVALEYSILLIFIYNNRFCEGKRYEDFSENHNVLGFGTLTLDPPFSF